MCFQFTRTPCLVILGLRWKENLFPSEENAGVVLIVRYKGIFWNHCIKYFEVSWTIKYEEQQDKSAIKATSYGNLSELWWEMLPVFSQLYLQPQIGVFWLSLEVLQLLQNWDGELRWRAKISACDYLIIDANNWPSLAFRHTTTESYHNCCTCFFSAIARDRPVLSPSYLPVLTGHGDVNCGLHIPRTTISTSLRTHQEW